jgi:hypothetical protein
MARSDDYMLTAEQLRLRKRRTVFDRIIVSLRNFPRLTFSRRSLAVAWLILTLVVGYADYLTGYERSLLLFYLLPISLAAWFGNLAFGLAIVFVCVLVWVLSDLAAGIPRIGFWNIGTAFASYALFAGVLSKLRALIRELDQRVHERTAALEREMAERRRLDQEIARVFSARSCNATIKPSASSSGEKKPRARFRVRSIPSST